MTPIPENVFLEAEHQENNLGAPRKAEHFDNVLRRSRASKPVDEDSLDQDFQTQLTRKKSRNKTH
jgi:hypothetical protein